MVLDLNAKITNFVGQRFTKKEWLKQYPEATESV